MNYLFPCNKDGLSVSGRHAAEYRLCTAGYLANKDYDAEMRRSDVEMLVTFCVGEEREEDCCCCPFLLQFIIFSIFLLKFPEFGIDFLIF